MSFDYKAHLQSHLRNNNWKHRHTLKFLSVLLVAARTFIVTTTLTLTVDCYNNGTDAECRSSLLTCNTTNNYCEPGM